MSTQTTEFYEKRLLKDHGDITRRVTELKEYAVVLDPKRPWVKSYWYEGCADGRRFTCYHVAGKTGNGGRISDVSNGPWFAHQLSAIEYAIKKGNQ